jgi:hypothetical protein
MISSLSAHLTGHHGAVNEETATGAHIQVPDSAENPANERLDTDKQYPDSCLSN